MIAGLATGLAGCLDDDENGNGDDGNGDDGNGTDDGNGSDDGNGDDGNGDDGNGTDDGNGDSDTEGDTGGVVAELTLILENEDGDPVSSGVSILVGRAEESVAHDVTATLSEGEAVAELYQEGDFVVTIDSQDDEFETVEETVTVDGDDELTFELEGATGDEAEDDGEDDADGSDDGDADDGNGDADE